jgi:Raf kinase inhibitor-like YbhB/YbcL family protein
MDNHGRDSVAVVGQDGHMRFVRLAALGLALVLAGCGSGGSPAAAPPAGPTTTAAVASTLTVTSPAFTEGAVIPAGYTCAGAGQMPSIAWTGDLQGAAAIAVIVDDPDAPGGTFVHLIVVDLPAGTSSLGDSLPGGARYATNSAGRPGWTPPCPPSGTHHYRFTVYGLNAPTGLAAGASADAARAAITARAVVQGRLTGLVAH